MTNSERFVKGIADFGTLFLVLTLPQMRKQGLTYPALYALHKIIEAEDEGFTGLPESALRKETGLPDYEVSRACRYLVGAGLLKTSTSKGDKRTRVLASSPLGRKVWDRILAAAAERLHDSIDEIGRFRRLQGAVEHLRKARRKLHGSIQLSFFEREFQRGKRPKVPVPRRTSVHSLVP